MEQSLSDTLHKIIDLLPWREEREVLTAHASVTSYFADPLAEYDDKEETE